MVNLDLMPGCLPLTHPNSRWALEQRIHGRQQGVIIYFFSGKKDVSNCLLLANDKCYWPPYSLADLLLSEILSSWSLYLYQLGGWPHWLNDSKLFEGHTDLIRSVAFSSDEARFFCSVYKMSCIPRDNSEVAHEISILLKYPNILDTVAQNMTYRH